MYPSLHTYKHTPPKHHHATHTFSSPTFPPPLNTTSYTLLPRAHTPLPLAPQQHMVPHTHPHNPNKTYTPLFTNPSLPTMQLLLTNRCILNYLYAYYSIVALLHAIKHFVDTNRNCLQQLIVHIVNALDFLLCRLRRHKKTRNPHAAQTLVYSLVKEQQKQVTETFSE